MKGMKKTIISMIALVTACGMLSTAAMAEAPAEEPEIVPVPAAEEIVKEADPVQGSWVLNEVYEIKEGAEPVLLKKEENQSLYGSGIGIYTFDDEGYAHYNMIEGVDNLDLAATWESPEEGTYLLTEEDADTMEFKYAEDEDTLHRTFQEADRTLDFVYARAFVGSWKLDEVLEIHEGDAPVELKKEENQSLYAEAENILTFNTDGTTKEEVADGPDKTEVEGTWELGKDQDQFTLKEDTLEMEFHYFRVDDTIYRDVKDETEEAAQPYLRFIYTRVTPETGESDGDSASGESAAQPAGQQAAAPQQPEDELIADGQIFTGAQQTLYDPETGAAVVVSELNQGGWANEATGVIYEQEGGGGDHYYGNDGSMLISEWLYMNGNGEDELIADGQIFSGLELTVYDPNTGNPVVIKELNQGGWANEATGVIYSQEVAGGGHFYGNDGSVLVTEWEYMNGGGNEELIADGQIFSGQRMTVYDEATGEAAVVSELNQGGWVNEETGVMYQIGTDNRLYGDDGSVMIFE